MTTLDADFLPDRAFFSLAEADWQPWHCLAPAEMLPEEPEAMEAAAWRVGGFWIRAYMDAERTRALCAVDLAAILEAAEAECSA